MGHEDGHLLYSSRSASTRERPVCHQEPPFGLDAVPDLGGSAPVAVRVDPVPGDVLDGPLPVPAGGSFPETRVLVGVGDPVAANR